MIEQRGPAYNESDPDKLVVLITTPPLVPSKASNEGFQQAYGNFIVCTTSFPELTLPIETAVSGSQFADFASLTEVALVVKVGPANAVPINLSSIVNSSIYRVPATQSMPGALLDLDRGRPQFKPYLPFVGSLSSKAKPAKKTVHLDLDDYQ
jgi:hypothetical protein